MQCCQQVISENILMHPVKTLQCDLAHLHSFSCQQLAPSFMKGKKRKQENTKMTNVKPWLISPAKIWQETYTTANHIMHTMSWLTKTQTHKSMLKTMSLPSQTACNQYDLICGVMNKDLQHEPFPCKWPRWKSWCSCSSTVMTFVSWNSKPLWKENQFWHLFSW